MPARSDQLFSQVATRGRLASFSLCFYRATLAVGALYLILVLLSRLLAVIPDYFDWWTLALVPAAGLLVAAVGHRGISKAQAARLVDVRMDTKDLYLTAAMIDLSPATPGEYKPLVTDAAEEKAGAIRPATVVPFAPWERTARLVGLMALLAASLLLPQLDPFHKEAERQRIADRLKRLEDEKIAIAKKAEAIARKEDLTAETSQEVTQVLQDLRKTFEQMKREEPKENHNKLIEQKQRIGEKWQQKKQENEKRAAKERMAEQLVSSANAPKIQEMKEELKQGKTDKAQELAEQVQKLADKMEQAGDKGDSKEQQQTKQEMQQKLQQLSDFAKSQGGSKEMQDAVQKAMEQLAQGGDPQATQKAMEALKESMNLTQKQLQEMAQQMRDQKQLEKAMEAIRRAQQANSKQALDGKQCEGAGTMQEYADLFKKLGGDQMADAGQSAGQGDGQGQGQGQGQGEGQGDGTGDPANGQGGTGGAGQGKGNKPPEGPDTKVTFKDEKSKSHLQAGKVLLQWKQQELPESGKSQAEYRKAVEDVKQGVAEAIKQEQIPPGLQEAVKKYFDSYDKAGAGKGKEAPVPKGPEKE